MNVEEAAKELDKMMPGWADKVDLERLDQDSIQHDMLEQLGGNFEPGPLQDALFNETATAAWVFEVLKRLRTDLSKATTEALEAEMERIRAELKRREMPEGWAEEPGRDQHYRRDGADGFRLTARPKQDGFEWMLTSGVKNLRIVIAVGSAETAPEAAHKAEAALAWFRKGPPE